MEGRINVFGAPMTEQIISTLQAPWFMHAIDAALRDSTPHQNVGLYSGDDTANVEGGIILMYSSNILVPIILIARVVFTTTHVGSASLSARRGKEPVPRHTILKDLPD